MPITRGHFSKSLWPGVKDWFGNTYNEWEEEWSKIFEVVTSDKAYEEFVGHMGFDLPAEKPEGTAVTYGETRQTWLKRYTPVVYALGFQVTKEMFSDNLYSVIKFRSEELAKSFRIHKEITCANVLNRAFSGSYVGADGLELCSTAHLYFDGGTYANEPSAGANISEYALEQGCIDIAGWKDDKSHQRKFMPQMVIVPRQLGFETARILDSPLQNNTANNAINAIKNLSVFPKGVTMNHYLTDTNAWFIQTDCPKGLTMLQRWPLEFDTDNDNGYHEREVSWY